MSHAFPLPPWWVALAAALATVAALLIPHWAGTGEPPGEVATEAPAAPRAIFHGDLVLTTPGEVIDGLDIRGFVRVEAPNVTISNSVIRGRATEGDAILLYAGTGRSPGLRVIDTEFAPSHHTHRTHGVYGADFTLTRLDIHHVVDGVHIFGDNVTIEHSHLHSHLHFESDPSHDGGPSHDDGIQVQQGRNIRIIGNVLSGAHNAAIQITQDRGPVAHVQIRDNTLSGGGCSINVAEKGAGPIAGLVITGNEFGESRHACPMLIPPTTQAELADNRADGHDTVRVDRRAQ